MGKTTPDKEGKSGCKWMLIIALGIILAGVLVVGGCVLLGALGIGGMGAAINEASKEIQKERVAEEAAARNAAIDPIKWETIEALRKRVDGMTSVQKKEAEADYVGKRVEWSGIVWEVSDQLVGEELTITVEMDDADEDVIRTSDVSLDLFEDQSEAAKALKKGDVITFRGTLRSVGGGLMNASLEHGVLVP